MFAARTASTTAWVRSNSILSSTSAVTITPQELGQQQPGDDKQHLAALVRFGRRRFSVKELPWCSPSDSPNRRHQKREGPSTPNATKEGSTATVPSHFQQQQQQQPIPQFGIVAAMAADSRVIGIQGRLPWKSTIDRNLFTSLTNNGILIVGRKTLQDEQNCSLGHVRHAKYCIVISTSVSSVDGLLKAKTTDEKDRDWKMLRVASSLNEALNLARSLQNSLEDEDKGDDDGGGNIPSSLNCWVAGGERLFEEALKHPSATELHLSVLDVDVDITNIPLDETAKFPAKYRWDHNYQQVSSQRFDESRVPNAEPTFTYLVYQRIQRNMPKL